MLTGGRWSTALWLLTLIALIGERSRLARADDADDGTPPVVDQDFAKHTGHSKTDDESLTRKQDSESGANVSDDSAELRTLFDNVEAHKFHTQQDRMMKLIINSLYKTKEIFIRELISNGSDALDKIKHESYVDPHALDADPDLSIRIKVDKEHKLLHIMDSGIGMTKKHLADYLGTIAKSATSEFLQAVEKGGENEKVVNDLIGQFGVGFYSAFLVSDRVVVTSKHNDDVQCVWESDSKEYRVTEDTRPEKIPRGTTVTLHLKEEAEEYLDLNHLRNIAVKYSQFVNYPIYLWDEKTEEVPAEEGEAAEKPADTENEDVNVADEDDKPKEKDAKMVSKTVWFWNHLNNVKPIWQRNPKEVSEEDYSAFFKALTKTSDDPLLHIQFAGEGEVNFRSVLFIPKAAPVQYAHSMNPLKPDNIKLYVRRVFITDHFDDFLPIYLSFVHGIVDSDDLPLNVSRETLQQHRLLTIIRRAITRKILDTLIGLDEEKYITFWKEFGTQIKLGLTQDNLNRGRLGKLLRFYSSASPDKYTSLTDYVSRMREGQKDIFYVAASTLGEAQKSPFVEKVISHGYEVLYFIDTADQYCLQNLPNFDGKTFQNVAKEGLQLDISDKEQKKKEQLETEFEPLKRYLEESFSDKVLKVSISDRLVETPMVFIASQWGYDGNMERISLAQAAQKVGGDVATLHFANMKRKMEINPHHPIIKDLLNRVKRNKADAELREYAEVCVDVALIRSGYILRDSMKFTERVENLLKESMHVPKNAAVDKPQFDDDDDELDRTKPETASPEPSEKVKTLPGMRVMSISKKPAVARHKRVSKDSNGKSKRSIAKKKTSKKSKKSGEKKKNKNKHSQAEKKHNEYKVNIAKKGEHRTKQERAYKVPKKIRTYHNKTRLARNNNHRMTDKKMIKRPRSSPPAKLHKIVVKVSKRAKSHHNNRTRSAINRSFAVSHHGRHSLDILPSASKKKNKRFANETTPPSKNKTSSKTKSVENLKPAKAELPSSAAEQKKATVPQMLAQLWQKLVCAMSLNSSYDVEANDGANSVQRRSSGFAMAAKIPEKPPSSKTDGEVKLPDGVTLRNGKLCVGFKYRYRISNFLRSQEGRSVAKILKEKIPDAAINISLDETDPRSRVIIRKPPVGFAFRYRISNYVKTLSPEDLDDLYSKGYLRPIIVMQGSDASDLASGLNIDALMPGDKRPAMVLSHIYQFLLDLISYKKCVEWKEVPLPPQEEKKPMPRNKLYGQIGWEYRYRLSRKLAKLKEQPVDDVIKPKIKPHNVGPLHRYRVSQMLENLNTTYESMVSMIADGSWNAYREEKEAMFLSKQKDVEQFESAEKDIENLKLIGASCPDDISIKIEDLYPEELLRVGYEYRYRRSRKMRALGISPSVIEKKRWALIEEQIRKNVSSLLEKDGQKLPSDVAQKEVEGVFVLDYSRLTPEERKVGFQYRYRISRKFMNQLPSYVLDDLSNKPNTTKAKVTKLPALKARHKRIKSKNEKRKARSKAAKALKRERAAERKILSISDIQNVISLIGKHKENVRNVIVRSKSQRGGKHPHEHNVEKRKKKHHKNRRNMKCFLNDKQVTKIFRDMEPTSVDTNEYMSSESLQETSHETNVGKNSLTNEHDDQESVNEEPLNNEELVKETTTYGNGVVGSMNADTHVDAEINSRQPEILDEPKFKEKDDENLSADETVTSKHSETVTDSREVEVNVDISSNQSVKYETINETGINVDSGKVISENNESEELYHNTGESAPEDSESEIRDAAHREGTNNDRYVNESVNELPGASESNTNEYLEDARDHGDYQTGSDILVKSGESAQASTETPANTEETPVTDDAEEVSQAGDKRRSREVTPESTDTADHHQVDIDNIGFLELTELWFRRFGRELLNLV